MKSLLGRLGYLSAREADNLIQAAVQEAMLKKDHDLASKLLERGGFATLQLNPDPKALPRVKIIEHSEAVRIPKSEGPKYGIHNL